MVFRRTVNDREWLAGALSVFESARPIALAFNQAFADGGRQELNGAVGIVLHELPSLARQLDRLPGPKSREARVANSTLRRSLDAYICGARELDSLFELSTQGLHQVVASRGRTAQWLYSAHIGAIQAIAGRAAGMMGEASQFFAGTMVASTPGR